MSIEKTRQIIAERLKAHGQAHLLSFWAQLDSRQQSRLLSQLEKLDLPAIDDWIARYIKNPAAGNLGTDLAVAPSYPPVPDGPRQQRKYSEAIDLGKKLISDGKVAAFIVAGGQGTRLGFDGPKGDFPVTPVKNKTLFQTFAETIAAVRKKYDAICPWYVMTSPLNHDETVRIFRANDYYGLNTDDIFILEQGTLPNFDFDGKVLLADKDCISWSPDGHGGSLKALYESGALKDMKKRGIELVSYFQVDNPLVNIFDPLFIGLHALDDAQMSSKAVQKKNPEEKVGVFALVNGKVTVIEYSDLSKEQAQRRNPDGTLTFDLGSIAIHIINTSFVEKLNEKGFSLPLHRAVKTIPHIDRHGEQIAPDKPNGIKLESFVFDALPLASRSVILQTVRQQEFAPVKNATGTDSVDSAKELIIARAAHWLESAGINVPRKPDQSVDAIIEIAPSFALEKADIKTKLKDIPTIKPKDKIYLA